MTEVLEIRSQDGAAMAVFGQGKVYIIAEATPKDKVADVMLATIGWSGARKLAKHCLTDLTVEIYRYLDLARADDFVQAYVDARTRNPELEPQQARLLVMPYWLLENGPHERPDDEHQRRVKRWLRPALFKKRDRLSRSDLVALACMGLEHEAEGHGPMTVMS
jgi:hypothetical protein